MLHSPPSLTSSGLKNDVPVSPTMCALLRHAGLRPRSGTWSTVGRRPNEKPKKPGGKPKKMLGEKPEKMPGGKPKKMPGGTPNWRSRGIWPRRCECCKQMVLPFEGTSIHNHGNLRLGCTCCCRGEFDLWWALRFLRNLGVLVLVAFMGVLGLWLLKSAAEGSSDLDRVPAALYGLIAVVAAGFLSSCGFSSYDGLRT